VERAPSYLQGSPSRRLLKGSARLGASSYLVARPVRCAHVDERESPVRVCCSHESGARLVLGRGRTLGVAHGRKEEDVNRGGFSWKRLLGVTAAKSHLSRRIGVPLSRSGRQQKLGRLASGAGCLFPLLLVVLVTVAIVFFLFSLS
jgi:hypothetical protein